MTTDSKPTNPKDAVSIAKVPTWVIPFRVLRGVGLAVLEGARKYGAYNWRVAGVRASVYYDAAMGHLGDWWEGQDIDADSGLSHIDKAIASLVVLRDGMYEGNWTDDRPPKARGEYVGRNDPRVAALIEKHPEPAEAFTEKSAHRKRLLGGLEASTEGVLRNARRVQEALHEAEAAVAVTYGMPARYLEKKGEA
jgi:hypothetical protein